MVFKSIMEKIRLHLIGKKYVDRLLYVDRVELSETNNIIKTEERYGGIFNITDEIPGIEPEYSPLGEKEAVIISEISESRRTSLVRENNNVSRDIVRKHNLMVNLLKTYDWTHLAYGDDLESSFIENQLKDNTSIDFCTTQDRTRYKGIMDRCRFVFDSRERKGLYDKLETDTIIILHDPSGCEAIFKGIKIIEHHSPPPVSGLSVNGAGDIFSAVFIKEFLTNSLKSAVTLSCEITTNILKQRRDNEKI